MATKRPNFGPLSFLIYSFNLYRNKATIMKPITLIIALISLITFSSSAQMKSLFYGQSWSDVTKLADSISLATHLKLDSSSMTKSGKAQTLFFSDASGACLQVSILKANAEADKILTISITGHKEAVLALYGMYFNKSFQEAPVMPLQLASLPNGQTLPVACYQDTRRPERWILASKTPN